MMNRRGSILAGPRVVEAQQGGKVYRLGVLPPGVRPAQSSPSVIE